MRSGFIFSTSVSKRQELEARIIRLFALFRIQATCTDTSLVYQDIVTVRMRLSGNPDQTGAILARVNALLYPESRLIPVGW